MDTKKFKEIHVVNNTHWDREWRHNFQKSRMMLVKMMDHLLELLENNPEYSSYTLDADTIMVEDYLSIRPETRERLEKLVTDRRLFVGPWFTLPDMFNIGQESIVRNLLVGTGMARDLGHCMQVGYTPCSWGQTGQLPQLYADIGIDTILFYRGFSLHEAPAEFIWEAPDGTQALTHRFAVFARYNYYYLVYRRAAYGKDLDERNWYWGEHDECPMRFCDGSDPVGNVRLYNPHIGYDKEHLRTFFEQMLEREGGEYFGEYFLGMHGHDISFPHILDARTAIDGNEQFDDLEIKVSNLEDYMGLLKGKLDFSKLTVLKGERRTSLKYGMWTYLFPGTISARVPLKQHNFETEHALIYFAEPLASLAYSLGAVEEYPEQYLDIAWKYLLTNHTHDAHAGCGTDKITEDVHYRYRQATELADGCVGEMFSGLITHVKPGTLNDKDMLVMVYNPTQTTRKDVIDLILETPAEANANSLHITDDEGNVYDYQPVKHAPAAIFADNYWDVPEIYDSRRFEIKFSTGTIPPFGYKVFRVEPREDINRYSGSLLSGARTFENEFMQVTINDNGTFDIVHKVTGKEYKALGYFMDSGEAGNAWQHRTPHDDVVVNSLGNAAKIAVVRDGRCAVTFKVELEMEVPAEKTSDGTGRSEYTAVIPICRYITLKRGVPRLEIRTELENNARDHWLRVVFPTGLDTNYSFANSHFDIVKRDIQLPDTDTWKEATLGTKPMKTFADLNDGEGGLAVTVRGLQEFEAIDKPDRPIAVTLLRAFPIVLEVSEQKKQIMPDMGPQCPGKHVFEYAVYPHTGNTFTGGVQAQAEEYAVPLRAVQFAPSSEGTLPWSMGMLKSQPEHLIITAVKKAQKHDAIVLRMFNPYEKEVEETLEFGPAIQGAARLNIIEEKQGDLEVKNNTLTLNVPKKKIVTVAVTLER